jgi:hypothetical protein
MALLKFSLLRVTLVVSTTLKYDICSIQMFKVLEGRAYRLQHPWVGIVNRSQADINKNVDMIVARRKEREYFETSPEYGHLSNKMGSEYLAKLLSKVLFIHVTFKLFSLIYGLRYKFIEISNLSNTE